MREVLPDAELMPRYFSRHGYWSAGSGKLLHYVIDPPSWDDYFPDKTKDDPFPRTFDPKPRPVSLPRGGTWQYVETDWAALDVTNEQFGGDWLVTKWIGEQLQQPHDKPFFLACGIYRPHEPWFVPKKYFEPFPLESIQLPPGYKADDVDDLPPAGQRLARNRYFAHIQKHEQWKKGIQAYLASIHFADAMLGRVLDALEKSPQRDNTIVVLWSDHGWHLGEKEHWQKFTGWRVCARVPLMIRVPKGAPGLPEGTTPGSVCDRPVSLVDLFGTLTDLCGLPPKADIESRSLAPLLRNTPGIGYEMAQRIAQVDDSRLQEELVSAAAAGESTHSIRARIQAHRTLHGGGKGKRDAGSRTGSLIQLNHREGNCIATLRAKREPGAREAMLEALRQLTRQVKEDDSLR